MRTWVGSLVSLSELRIRHCHELWCRSQLWLDPALLWLWHRPAAAALIRPQAWEPPHAEGVAQKWQKKKKQTQKTNKQKTN